MPEPINAQKSIIQTRRHPIYAKRMTQLDLNRLAAKGGRDYIERRLWRAPNETDTQWFGDASEQIVGRKERSCLINDAQRIVSKINQYIFKKTPERKGIDKTFAANCGGVLTVIGDPVGLVLWNNGAVTATNYSMSLLLPCLVAWVLPTWWIGRSLPETVSVERVVLPYRGDDTNLNVWQRVMMLVVGIGGLWFIPTFHNITKLSPFLGALCVLSVLWIVNEVVNRRLITDEMIHRRVPRVLQYGVLQMMLFVMGSMLALGVVRETGMLDRLLSVFHELIGGVWTVGALTGLLSTVLDSFLSALTIISVPDVVDGMASQTVTGGFDAALVQNGAYWKIVAFAAAVGGNILCIGSASGLAFVKMERVRVGWYFRNVGWKCLVGALGGLAVLWAVL